MASEAVLFDLDGPLVASSELFAQFLGHLCNLYKRSSIIRIRDSYYDLTKLTDLRLVFPEPHQKVYEMLGVNRELANREHHQYMQRHIPSLTPGIESTLKKLNLKGCKIGIATSNSRGVTEKRLLSYGIRSQFEAVVCEEDVKNPKPHPEPIIKCLSILDAQGEQTPFIGDLPIDIKAGKAAGVITIGASWALGTYDSLARENPDYIAKSVSELERILNL